MSDSLRSLTNNEQMCESLIFLSELLIRSFFRKKTSDALRKPSSEFPALVVGFAGLPPSAMPRIFSSLRLTPHHRSYLKLLQYSNPGGRTTSPYRSITGCRFQIMRSVKASCLLLLTGGNLYLPGRKIPQHDTN